MTVPSNRESGKKIARAAFDEALRQMGCFEA